MLQCLLGTQSVKSRSAISELYTWNVKACYISRLGKENLPLLFYVHECFSFMYGCAALECLVLVEVRRGH